MKNKGSTLNLNIKGKKSKSKKSESLFFPQEKTLNVTAATVHHSRIKYINLIALKYASLYVAPVSCGSLHWILECLI